jgi:hypothetical protein
MARGGWGEHAMVVRRVQEGAQRPWVLILLDWGPWRLCLASYASGCTITEAELVSLG